MKKGKLFSILASIAMVLSLCAMPVKVNAVEPSEPKVYDGNVVKEELILNDDFIADGDNGAIWVKNGAQLAIKGNAKVHALNTTGYGMAVWASNGSHVDIYGGNYTNEPDQTDGEDTAHVDLIYASKNSTVNIYGGTYRNATPKWTLNCGDRSNSVITVYGGTFYQFDPSNTDVTPNGEPKEVVVAEGYKVIKNGDWYTVIPEVNTPTSPTIPTGPVDEVTAGTNDEAKEIVIEQTEAILADIVAGEEVTNVSKETVSAIKDAIVNKRTISTEVVAKTVEETKVKEDALKVEEKIGATGTVAQYLDLSIVVMANGEGIGTINKVSKPLTFTIAVPEDLKAENRDFYVVRVHDGVAEKLPTTLNKDGTLTFETDKFSTYALVYEDEVTLTIRAIVDGEEIDLTKVVENPEYLKIKGLKGDSFTDEQIKELAEMGKDIDFAGYTYKGIFLDKEGKNPLQANVAFNEDADLYMIWNKATITTDPADPTVPPKEEPNPTPKPEEKPNDKVQTSDNTNVTLYATFAGLALVGAAIVVAMKKREDLLNK